ncbi:MAG: hypothetical protein VB064_08325 [Oscillospiraceae bacterium]|nr:hypothetical protein [Oscillospiraceae bacterium]
MEEAGNDILSLPAKFDQQVINPAFVMQLFQSNDSNYYLEGSGP